MRRVFSTFGDRLPSHGLLILRVIAATVLIVRCFQLDRNGAPLQTIAPHAIAAVAGLFVLFGWWTSAGGAVVAIIELFIATAHNHDPWLSVLLATVGIAVALLGPGTWSVDARRSGWKRIEIPRPDN